MFLGAGSNRQPVLVRLGRDEHRQAAFWVSAVLALTREITSYRRDPHQPGGIARIRRLHTDLAAALRHAEHLHHRLC
jgi:hypothetical protein